MAENRLVVGKISNPLFEFDHSALRKITLVNSVDIVGAELSSDQLTPVVEYDKDAVELWAPAGYDSLMSSEGLLFATSRTFSDIRTLPYGTEVRWYRDGELKGKFYVRNVDRVAKENYQINAMSAVGLLDRQRHYGGIYTRQTFEEVAADILGGAIAYTVDPSVAAIRIFGWLPIASRRENLHQLLFATGAALLKDEEGEVRFAFLQEDSVPVPDRRFYYGGNVDYSSPATGAEVTEHTFEALDNDETVTLFDNTEGGSAANNTFVAFRDAPVHDLKAGGNLTIVSYGVNYAVLTGVGTLTGKKYTHITKIVSKAADGDTGEENVVTVTDATLVSVANSENVAKRVLAYYSSKKTVSAAIVLDGETAGGQIDFNDPYGERSSGFLQSMEINVSSNLKAQCTIITDYTPVWCGNNYFSAQLLTGSGTFTVGENGAQATLISGGKGGQSGGDGNPGSRDSDKIPCEGGNGGKAGAPGRGGRVYTVTLPPGTYTFNCGTGGDGGVSDGLEPVEGQNGTDTVITAQDGTVYSSAGGIASDHGYLNQFSGDVYGLPGSAGIRGGKGGKTVYGSAGYEAESVTFEGQTWTGGATGGMRKTDSDAYLFDGGGGGAAVGQNGSDGGTTTSWTYPAHGGNGGSAISRAASTSYGNGGDGGHGGGGGGGAGAGVYGSGLFSRNTGTPGAGGKGGTGGKGSDGCIVIYS